MPRLAGRPLEDAVEDIGYAETREYVKRIFAYTMIYEWRLGREPTPVTLHLQGSDPDGQTLTFTATGLPAGLTMSSAGHISGTPTTQIAPKTTYNFRPAARDPEGRTLRFSIVNKPSWAAFSSNSGALTGYPMSAALYSNIVIRVSDDGHGMGREDALLALRSELELFANLRPVKTLPETAAGHIGDRAFGETLIPQLQDAGARAAAAEFWSPGHLDDTRDQFFSPAVDGC